MCLIFERKRTICWKITYICDVLDIISAVHQKLTIMTDIKTLQKLLHCLDEYMKRTGKREIDEMEANIELARVGCWTMRLHIRAVLSGKYWCGCATAIIFLKTSGRFMGSGKSASQAPLPRHRCSSSSSAIEVLLIEVTFLYKDKGVDSCEHGDESLSFLSGIKSP